MLGLSQSSSPEASGLGLKRMHQMSLNFQQAIFLMIRHKSKR
jgi:hypothetical protein